MKTVETLARWNWVYDYRIDRIVDDDLTRILLLKEAAHPFGVISLIEYPTIQITSDQFTLMRWENLIRCSNYYGYPPEEHAADYRSPGYLALAVQKHVKPAATLRCSITDPFITGLAENLPDDCLLLPYREENTTFVCRKGALSVFYDLDMVKEVYDAHRLKDVDWQLIKRMCNKEIAFFADSGKSCLYIERGANGTTEKVFVGLLLGYPIESTVASINRTDRVATDINRATRHFKASDEPVFINGNIWTKQGDSVFTAWMQECLYY